MALWVGIVSQFLPVVGTYLAGVLPLLGTGALRASVGCLLGILSIEAASAFSPFIDPNMNSLLIVALHQISLTFLAALPTV
jgi:hypothetical protein